jgi:mannose-6-phosphate isomerase
MNTNLYPLKFKGIYKDKIWGGQKLRTELGKDFGKLKNCGESWEISGVQGDISVVANGFLAGNTLEEIVETYLGDLVGDKVYDKFGIEFPLLIKFIDANDDLSIQVHPNDEIAEERHESYGKTEMWYVLQAEEGAELISGFSRKIDCATYLNYLEKGKLTEILNSEEVKQGDVFFMPAGRVHAIGAGILLAEIQQTSDITYRIFDYNRLGDDGQPRQLHTDEALDVIDYNYYDDYKSPYEIIPNKTTNIVECNYFKTNILTFNQTVSKDYNLLDSFVIYICLEGNFKIVSEGETVEVKKGETVLLPAVLKNVDLEPGELAKILEVYIK